MGHERKSGKTHLFGLGAGETLMPLFLHEGVSIEENSGCWFQIGPGAKPFPCHKGCKVLSVIATIHAIGKVWDTRDSQAGTYILSFDHTLWTRIESGGQPVYVRGDKPTWFVPNRAGDAVLEQVREGTMVRDLPSIRFLERLDESPVREYPGRDEFLKADHLRELWFHITNRCNLSCKHCLFASSPGEQPELSTERILGLADEAAEMGCRVFALTGGESFVHPGFTALVDRFLSYGGDTHAVVLTNGTRLDHFKKDILRWGPERFHLQVSVDGLETNHDRLRGKGAFRRLSQELAGLRDSGFPFTVSMAVESGNVADMPAIIDFAADAGATNVHFMWYFIRGRGTAEGFALPNQIFEQFILADKRAVERGISIDNLTALRTQVFAPSGTIHDGTNSGWESAAIGPDGNLYPSAALVGEKTLVTEMNGSLASAWRDSETLQAMRLATARDQDSPWRYIVGGGDSDHSYAHAGEFMGADPYEPLYERLVLWLITREAALQPVDGPPGLRLKMGEILESCGAHGSVALVHSNCLLAMAQEDRRTSVKEFYSAAAEDTKEDIVNPVCYPEEDVRHIPPEYRFRGYGCGSPVMDADIRNGECVVDLGSGRGVECFIASRAVGPSGQVTGIDMLDPMLVIAEEGAVGVAKNLGYNNMAFRKGYLEELPVEDGTVDLVLSNCVLNLSPHKRRTFNEIYRVLREGGRMVVSDVVCEEEPDAAMRNDEVLRGECIAGALRQRDLVGLLEESGFQSFRVIKRFPYRVVGGHPFFSMTFEAWKQPVGAVALDAVRTSAGAASRPSSTEQISVMYRGPAPSLVTAVGRTLTVGQTVRIPRHEAEQLGEQIFIFDDSGMAINVETSTARCCSH